MSIKVKIAWHLKYLTDGRGLVETEGRNVGQCLDNLEARFPGIKKEISVRQKELRGLYQIFIKSTNSYTLKLDSPVKKNDELTIQFIVSGG
ncbi:MAG: hypothetical protein J7K94_05240 [Dehalococcoidia bacterium]|nr:hypothetical protein [Dehalococcoidia bacterium]